MSPSPHCPGFIGAEWECCQAANRNRRFFRRFAVYLKLWTIFVQCSLLLLLLREWCTLKFVRAWRRCRLYYFFFTFFVSYLLCDFVFVSLLQRMQATACIMGSYWIREKETQHCSKVERLENNNHPRWGSDVVRWRICAHEICTPCNTTAYRTPPLSVWSAACNPLCHSPNDVEIQRIHKDTHAQRAQT